MAKHESSPDIERVKSKEESVECRTFRRCFSVLADGITDPGWLAVQLYSRELIGRDIRTEAQKPAVEERAKSVKLLSAVEDQIVTSPATKFREFLDVLQNEPSLQHLATRLENTHHELSESAPLPPAKRPCFAQSITPYNSGGQSCAVDAYASYLKSVYTREKSLIYDTEMATSEIQEIH